MSQANTAVLLTVVDAKLAVTERARVMDTVQLAALPLQAPLQPLKLYPEAGEAVSVTEAPDVYEPEQVPPQLMPDGLLVTVPDPDLETVSEYVVGGVGVGVGAGAGVASDVVGDFESTESPVLQAPRKTGTISANATAFSE